uniref:uncharacterized protein LOC120343349 n=1 Tax=Styela clava TaxID=7725 RepID=UPI00193A7D56|nr:uncharacterized protein LOC120343349 [Styela clava]
MISQSWQFDATKMHEYNCWFVLLTFLATSSAGLWKTVNRSFYILTFYNTDSTWYQAKSLCESSRSSLVQLDVTSIKNDVLNTVTSSGLVINYWIGATDEASEGHWKWMDGSSASITWNTGQPNGGRAQNYLGMDRYGKFYDYSSNHNRGVICMKAIPFTISSGIYRLTAIGRPHPKVTYETARAECANIQSRILKLTSATQALIKSYLNSDHISNDVNIWGQYVDSRCYSLTLKDYKSKATYCTDKHYYICEQAGPHDMQLSIPNFIVDSYTGTKEITCLTSGFPPPTVKWMKGKTVLHSTSNNNQAKVGKNLVLNLKQLTIEDEGQYKCFASNTVGQKFYEFSRTLDVKVPSQPSITNITSSPCNSDLLVTWKPHVRGVGIQHRFQIMDFMNINNYKVFLTTPNNVSMTSRVTRLQSSTSYIIRIEPCLTTSSTCFSQYATSRNATT